jgi:NCK adaptor protein
VYTLFKGLARIYTVKIFAMSRFGGSRRCVALFDYNAQDDEELTIKKNQNLTIINSEGSWWQVSNGTGGQGLVPCNYVKELPGSDGGPRNLPAEQIGMYQQTDLVKPSNGPSLNIRALAKFRYVSTREDELALEKGDEIIVLEKEADGWWRGRCGTRIGWFPFNYVEEISDTPSMMPVMQMGGATPSQPPPREKQFICGVVALYSFNSGNPEELVFNKGDLMDIIDQPPDDPDWWEAKKADGSTGLIPRNYVEVIHDATPVSNSADGRVPQAVPGKSTGPGGPNAAPPPFAHEPWYHGRMSRRDADRILEGSGANGQFLVRDSETKVRSWCIFNCY